MVVEQVYAVVAELAVEASLALYDLAERAQLEEVLFLLQKFLDQSRKTVPPCDNSGVHDRADHKTWHGDT